MRPNGAERRTTRVPHFCHRLAFPVYFLGKWKWFYFFIVYSESSPFLSPSWSGVYCFTNNKDRSANKLMQGIFGNSEMQILKDLENTYSTLCAGMKTWFCAFSTQLPNGVETRTTGTKGRLAKKWIWEFISGSLRSMYVCWNWSARQISMVVK